MLDINNTFFSDTVKPSPDSPGRRYRGVLAAGERLKSIEIRVEGINVLNHATFWSGDQNINSTTFGAMASMFYPPRVMQFAIHYRF